jgi:hypothetical protein
MEHTMRAKTINPYDARAYTCAVLELVDEGMLDKDVLIDMLLAWMSEHDVQQFCEANLRDDDTNECLIGSELDSDEEEDEVEAALDDFNYVGSRDHY